MDYDNLSRALYLLEDFISFKKIQIEKYCANKKCQISPDSPEWDMIIDLIKDYWCDLLATGYLNEKSLEEKNKIFSSVTIIFPYTTVPSSWLDGIDYVDFASF